jgi:hypothetical protein
VNGPKRKEERGNSKGNFEERRFDVRCLWHNLCVGNNRHILTIEMTSNDYIAKFRTAPSCVALATGLAAIEICTALFDSFWRAFIDLHMKLLGTPMSALGVWLFIPLAMFALMIIVAIIFGMCAARCEIWWQWLPMFLLASAITLCCLCSDRFLYIHPARWLGEKSNSSAYWYLGALLQLALALALLFFFRKPKPDRV